jgi:hypothetical protein
VFCSTPKSNAIRYCKVCQLLINEHFIFSDIFDRSSCLSLWILGFKDFRFVFIWVALVSLLSRWKHRYLTEVSIRIILSLRKTRGTFFGLILKVICVHLLSFVLIFHKLNYFCNLITCFCIYFMTDYKSGIDKVIAVSTKMVNLVIFDCARLPIYNFFKSELFINLFKIK